VMPTASTPTLTSAPCSSSMGISTFPPSSIHTTRNRSLNSPTATNKQKNDA
jgi:hypothetical protein